VAAVVYAVPVALAAVLDGWTGGLTIAFLSSAAIFAMPREQAIMASVLDTVALALLASLAALITSRERRLRRHYQQIADQLSSVYEKVQANFEGMKRAERLSAIGQLSAGLAHEIRNPLASIAGAAAILARSLNLDPKNAKCLQIITSECERLNGLLTNFLNFARPRPPRLQTVQLEPLLENVLVLASHGVRGKTVRFEKNIGNGLHPVECDPEQLEQVLLNLMINAIEASPEGGTVALSAATEESRIVIGVVDHGDGVAPVHIDRLFDPFFTTKEHGTGLGLPVAHQIVRQMGGSLLAQSNADHGMTFSVVLPYKVQN
jgi:signal transduction histidine kinase